MADNIQLIFNQIMELEAEAEKNLMLHQHNPLNRAEGYAEGRRDAFRICAKIIRSYYVVDYKNDTDAIAETAERLWKE